MVSHTQDSSLYVSPNDTKDYGAEISFLPEEFTLSLDTTNSERAKVTDAQK